MSELKKATLQAIKSDEKGTPLASPDGDEIEVQFNPTTLKLQLSNQVEGGQSRGKQTRQFLGTSSTTLTLELVFDTADEGTTTEPVNVRKKTAMVEKFVVPKSTDQKKEAPPKVRFHWGTLVLDGIIESLAIDFDLFAADGTPLRAKMGIAIKEQDSKYQFLKAGEGANKADNAPDAGANTPSSPGTSGGPANRSAPAIGGESSADFAARMGLDSSAWRGLSIGGGSSLSLDAGVEIGFSAGLSISAGIGVSVGVEAGVSASLEASFGLDVTAGISAVAGIGASANMAAGFSLSAAGGVGAAIESVKIAKSQAAEHKARAAFKAPATPASAARVGTSAARSASITGGAVITSAAAPKALTAASGAAVSVSTASATVASATAPAQRPAMPDQPRAPLSSSGLPSPAAQLAAGPAPAPPRADPRATSFGFGVPLRSSVGHAADLRAGAIQGRVALRPQVASGDPPFTEDPTTPPWVSLPRRDRARAAVDKASGLARPVRPCGCAGSCRHRGARR